MKVVDVGAGPPVVIVPGVQGRWEWMRPTVDALAERCRVLTFSLADEPTCGADFTLERGFDCYVEQVRAALDAAGVRTAAVVGVSYGGLVAAAFAARYAERVNGLVLVSAIPPGWTPNARVRFFVRAPRLLMPLFMLASVRMYREIASAAGGVLSGVRPAAAHAFNVLTHMFSPVRMSRRVWLRPEGLEPQLRALDLPCLVVTGEPGLDTVVPVHLTEQYLDIWPRAERVTIARTGHLGLITRPRAFADAVGSFAARHAERAVPRHDREKKVG